MKKKIAVVVTHPIQYHAVIWRAMAKEPDWDVKVMFCSDHGQKNSFDKDFNISFKWDVDLTNGYPHAFYKNSTLARKDGFLKYINLGILKELFFTKYDLVYFHGYGVFTSFVGIITAKLSGKTVVVRNIANNLQKLPETKRLVKKLLYTLYLKLPDYFLYIGQHNFNYYKDYGVPDKKLLYAPHVVDNKYFSNTLISYLSEGEKAIKAKFGIDEYQKVILFSGKLFNKKQPMMLLKAFEKANIKREWILLYVGDGVEKKELVEFKKNMSKNVVLSGFLNQKEIPTAYFISEIIILPSAYEETWGLVINEAFNFGCAAIVSNRVGCGPDLVKDKSGIIFPYNDEDALVKAIEKLANNEELLKQYQLKAQEIIKEYDVHKITDQIKIVINKGSKT